MAEYNDTRSDTGPPEGDSDVNGSSDVIVAGIDSETNLIEPGIHLDHTGQIANISNIFPPQADRALREMPGLAEQIAGLSLSATPQDTNERNIINIYNEIKVTIGDGGEGISAHLKTKVQTAEKIFVETVGYKDVCECLDYHGHVLICGSPGSGKTTMSLCIIGQYLKKNYKVVFLEDVSDFKPEKHVSNQVPTLIVFDDIFGYFSLTTKELVNCKKVFNFLKSRFQRLEEKRRKKQEKETGEDGRGNDGGIPLKVIMNSRTNVLESIRPMLLEYKNSLLKPSTIANLTTLTKLKDVDKERILIKHLKKAHRTLSDDAIKTIAHLEYSSLGFPHLCELFVDSLCPQDFAVDFFKEPMTYLVNQMTDIFGTDESRGRAGVLLLMVLNDGVVSLVDLQSEDRRKEDGLDRKLTKCEEIVKPLPSPEELYLAARNENKTFLSSEGDVMKFSHPTIHDAVAFVVGDRKPLFVLENCSLQFLLERTKVIKDLTGSPSGGDFTYFMINLTLELAVFLVKRLVKEISGCNFALPLSHQCFSIESNAQLLFEELSSRDSIETCLHSQDRKYGMGFLFWSSFICTGPLCKLSLTHSSFSLHEVMEGCFGCCMSGNVDSLQTLMSSSQSTEEITSSTLGGILDQQSKTRSFYRTLSSVGSPGKTDVMAEKETARMHGNTSDMLIHIAAANGFSEVVQVLLEHGAEIDAIGGNKMTALMHACYLGHTDLAKMLLAREADPFILDEEGDNCLHLACRSGSFEIVRLLHEKQMDLNTRGEHDRTPLMYASYNGHEDVVKFLLENGAVVEPGLTHVRNKNNSLHLACIKGHTNVVKILLDQGHMSGSFEIVRLLHEKQVDLNTRGEHDRTPLMYASYNGHEDVVKFLLENGAVVEPDLTHVRNKENSLHLACIKGHTNVVKILLDQGHMDIEMLGEVMRTPLLYACSHGQLETGTELVSRGAKLGVVDRFGYTCLHLAAANGHVPTAEWLFSIQAVDSVDCLSEKERTPLMRAFLFGQTDMVHFLLEEGASINKKDAENACCLNFAAKEGVLPLVDLCLEAGQDINATTETGFTPAMSACLTGNLELLQYLVQKGADVKKGSSGGCLHSAAFAGSLEIVKYLTSHFPELDINKPGHREMTPLLISCSRGFTDVAKYLVSRGTDVCCTDEYGRSCLHLACQRGFIELVEWLLNMDLVDTDGLDKNGMTPLMYAVKSDNPDVIIRRLLHEKQVDLNTRGEHDRTPLMYASYNGHEDVVKFLLENGAVVEPDLTHVRNKENSLHLACIKGHTNVVKILLDQGHMDIEMLGEVMRTPLLYACSHGQLETGTELVSRGAKLGVVDRFGYTCLHLAAANGHVPTAEWLFSIQAVDSVDCLSEKERTPLMRAFLFGQTDMVHFLLEEGASINKKDAENACCLNFAAKEGVLPLVDLCLEAGQDINATTETGFTPAMSACLTGNLELLQYLVQKGADVKKGSSGGCLHSAAFAGSLEIVKYLTSHFPELDINKPGHREMTPLLISCSRGFTDVAKYLVSRGTDVCCTDEYGRSCLHLACQRGFIELVEWLLNMDLVDTDGLDKNGMTPLMYAVKSDNPDVIIRLIQKGADLHKEDKEGRTYLHYAAWYGKAKSCTTLLDLGMNVDVQDRNNKTPLMSAFSNRDDWSEVIRILVQSGANIHHRTKNGNTYMHTAHPAQLDILIDLGLDINVRGAYSQTPIMLACRYGNKDLFEALYERRADVRLRNNNDASCLHLASMAEKVEDNSILTELLDAGLDVNAVDSHNKTPAMYAISNMNVHTLEFLLLRGANIKTFDQKGFKATLLHFACGVVNMNTEIPQLLITRGLDVNVRDRFLQTPAMCAARKGNRTLVEFLIRAGANLRMVDKRGRTCLSHSEEGDHRELMEYLHRMTYRGHRW